jgi:hypothetical protein
LASRHLEQDQLLDLIRLAGGILRLVAVGGVLWLGILLVGTLDDYITRGWLPVPGK